MPHPVDLFDVKAQTFQTDVVERSRHVPVVLRFWATQIPAAAAMFKSRRTGTAPAACKLAAEENHDSRIVGAIVGWRSASFRAALASRTWDSDWRSPPPPKRARCQSTSSSRAPLRSRRAQCGVATHRQDLTCIKREADASANLSPSKVAVAIARCGRPGNQVGQRVDSLLVLDPPPGYAVRASSVVGVDAMCTGFTRFEQPRGGFTCERCKRFKLTRRSLTDPTDRPRSSSPPPRDFRRGPGCRAHGELGGHLDGRTQERCCATAQREHEPTREQAGDDARPPANPRRPRASRICD
jgi:hypothetical protein